MDIFNRPGPPTIAEDTLHYTIRPQPSQSSRTAVASLAALIHAYAQQLLPNFIWHRDPFELKTVRDEDGLSKHNIEDNNSGWYLEGRMRVGDSVDDEWCVVWLLWEVSSRWDVAISVNDSDGEFLLIEAADYLPSWVEPSNAENRVWIYKSKLQLIPLTYNSPPSTKPKRQSYAGEDDFGGGTLEDPSESWLSIPDALKVLWSGEEETEASKEVQEAVLRRISGYPEAALHHLHVAKAYLPVDIAKALSQEPSLVQKAAEAFYTRDAIQLRAAQRMSRFPSQPSMLTALKLTRAAYAQLVGQKFHPPKVFAPITEPEGTREWKWKDIGMKIACGFEMLYQESKMRATNADVLSVSDEARLDALRRDPEFTEYIKKLISAGYFKNEREGSAQWKELERKAALVFVAAKAEDDASRPSFASLVNDAIARADINLIMPNLVEEPDDWLNVDAEDFDAKLAETIRSRPSNTEGDVNAMDVDSVDGEDAAAESQAEKLKGLAKKIENFVEGEGTLEGAVLDDDVLSDDEELSEFSDDDSMVGSVANNNEDDAESAVRREAMDKLVAGIDPSDYGKMPPSFYSNSQRVAPVTVETEGLSSTGSRATGTTNTDGSPSRSHPEPTRKPLRRPILPRDKFDGVDSDDETDEDDPAQGDSEDEEDKPQVVGEMEIDMAQEEEEFLSFSREMLGISDDQWRDIVRERQDRGAFVPSNALKTELTTKTPTGNASQIRMQSESGTQAQSPEAGTRPKANSIFNSFDEVMDAMEEELAKSRSCKKGTSNKASASQKRTTALAKQDNRPSTLSDKGKAPQSQVKDKAEDEGADEELQSAMDAELRAALAREDSDSEADEPMDYNLMKNFLESFKSQAGLSGPVGNLTGRLEPAWKLPRDET